MEDVIKIGYYGSPGSFSEEGAQECISTIDEIDTAKRIELISCGKDPKQVFSLVTNKEVDYGVVPVENSNHGIINDTYDLLYQSKIYVVGEAINKISQNLLVNKGITIKDITTVYSHNAAVNQCKKFISSNELEFKLFGDTATCAKKVKNEKLLNVGAIAGKRAAEIYDLEILQSDIQDNFNNYTRFFLIGTHECIGNGNKTSILIKLRNGLNSLYDYLGYFVKRDITLVKIDTRPSKDALFEYIIYMDFMGNIDDDNVKEAFHELNKDAKFVGYLGSYKAAEVQLIND